MRYVCGDCNKRFDSASESASLCPNCGGRLQRDRNGAGKTEPTATPRRSGLRAWVGAFDELWELWFGSLDDEELPGGLCFKVLVGVVGTALVVGIFTFLFIVAPLLLVTFLAMFAYFNPITCPRVVWWQWLLGGLFIVWCGIWWWVGVVSWKNNFED